MGKENKTDELEGSMTSSRTTEASINTLETKSCNVTLTDLDEDQIQDDQELEPPLLDDALKEEKQSEASSSSKSYEMLKLESLPTSGHTSGDDVEVITNTSSDIEVISSPVLSENGRRVQQQNHQLLQSRMVNASPRKDHPKHVKKGHFRTGSEVS